MALNESITMFIDQGLQTINTASIPFMLKLFAIFGIIWLFNVVLKSGGSIIEMLVYVYAFFKWLWLKIKGE